eukprot:SAG31_NODE_18664_length_627_cov_1.151515_1_plen_147_part_10
MKDKDTDATALVCGGGSHAIGHNRIHAASASGWEDAAVRGSKVVDSILKDGGTVVDVDLSLVVRVANQVIARLKCLSDSFINTPLQKATKSKTSSGKLFTICYDDTTPTEREVHLKIMEIEASGANTIQKCMEQKCNSLKNLLCFSF